MAQQTYIKKSSISPTIKEIKIESTMRSNLTLVRIDLDNTHETINIGEGI